MPTDRTAAGSTCASCGRPALTRLTGTRYRAAVLRNRRAFLAPSLRRAGAGLARAAPPVVALRAPSLRARPSSAPVAENRGEPAQPRSSRRVAAPALDNAMAAACSGLRSHSGTAASTAAVQIPDATPKTALGACRDVAPESPARCTSTRRLGRLPPPADGRRAKFGRTKAGTPSPSPGRRAPIVGALAPYLDFVICRCAGLSWLLPALVAPTRLA